MASGKKNYFRHSFHARKHPEIAGMIEDHGKEAYFHFFALVEVCAEKASDKFPEDSKFLFRRSTLCRELLVTNSRLSRHLLAMTPSPVDDIVVTEKEVEILFPKLRKYIGKYESKLLLNAPNKRKEKEIKEKEIKLNNDPKKNLPKKDSQEILKRPSPLSILFTHMPEVQAWLDDGTHDTHLLLLNKFSKQILEAEVLDMYVWAMRNSVKAESWMYKRLLARNINEKAPGLAQKPLSKKTNGVTPTPRNPTGNPYIQEAIDKGLIA